VHLPLHNIVLPRDAKQNYSSQQQQQQQQQQETTTTTTTTTTTPPPTPTPWFSPIPTCPMHFSKKGRSKFEELSNL